MAKTVLKNLRAKKLQNGFAAFLMEQESFYKWLLVAKENKEVWPWFESFLADTLDLEKSQLFDETCRCIMDQLFDFAKVALENRRNNSSHSFE